MLVSSNVERYEAMFCNYDFGHYAGATIVCDKSLWKTRGINQPSDQVSVEAWLVQDILNETQSSLPAAFPLADTG